MAVEDGANILDTCTTERVEDVEKVPARMRHLSGERRRKCVQVDGRRDARPPARVHVHEHGKELPEVVPPAVVTGACRVSAKSLWERCDQRFCGVTRRAG